MLSQTCKPSHTWIRYGTIHIYRTPASKLIAVDGETGKFEVEQNGSVVARFRALFQSGGEIYVPSDMRVHISNRVPFTSTLNEANMPQPVIEGEGVRRLRVHVAPEVPYTELEALAEHLREGILDPTYSIVVNYRGRQ